MNLISRTCFIFSSLCFAWGVSSFAEETRLKAPEVPTAELLAPEVSIPEVATPDLPAPIVSRPVIPVEERIEPSFSNPVVAHIDSDGDLITDGLDPNPLVPDAPKFSWWVSDVTVGWDLDQTQVDQLENKRGKDFEKQRKTSFTIGGGFGGGGGYSQSVSTNPSSIFLSLLPGGSLLKKASDGLKAESHLAVSFDLERSVNRTETVKEIRSEVRKLEQQRAIKNRHIEFTVEFFNRTSDVYQFSNFSIPVQTASRQTRAEAMCFVAGKNAREFEVPAQRPSGYPVRFRAMLSTTQSEQILDALENGDLRLAIERANGTAINQSSKVDEIAQRQQIATMVEKSTVAVEFRTENHSTSWRVAKHNPVTLEPTTVAEAIQAINQMTGSEYIQTSGGVVYAVGSFRNTPQNPFEVSNAPLAPLRVKGWTRLNRYGPEREGHWRHELDRPIGDRAIYSMLPYEVDQKDLQKQIDKADPGLAGEWLSLCHFWLHYDKEKAFAEYPLSQTSYPLAEFFNNLDPNFARANFEKMVSDWINASIKNRGSGESQAPVDSSIERLSFREKVRIYRRTILDAAFAGYSEAGALLARIDESERDEMETNAILAALHLGNTDAEAVLSINKLFKDLSRGGKVDLETVDLPDHVFAKNVLGFLYFAGCRRGFNPGDDFDAASRELGTSADLGNAFGQSMKGWMLVNLAHFKRSKLINRPHWPRDRDQGVALLKGAVDESVVAKYVLGKTLFHNRLGIDEDHDLAKGYLEAAVEWQFADSYAAMLEQFGSQ